MGLQDRMMAKAEAKMNKKMEKKWNKLQKKWAKKGVQVPYNKVVFICPNCGKKEIHEIVDPDQVRKITGNAALSEWIFSSTGSKFKCPKCGVLMSGQSQRR